MAHVGKIKVRVEIVHSDERERWQAMNALLSEQLEEARRWHLAAVNEKLTAQADAERLFTALDGYIMARITGTDLRDYDDLAERAVRAHRSLAAADREKPEERSDDHGLSELDMAWAVAQWLRGEGRLAREAAEWAAGRIESLGRTDE